MATCERVKKVDAKSVLELKKSDVEEFVKEILLQDGFPTTGWVRYVYFKRGYLYVTDEIHERNYMCWWDDEFLVFIIKNLLDYGSTICMPLEKYGLSWCSPKKDWIAVYLTDSFKDWALKDWIYYKKKLKKEVKNG